MRSIGFGFAVVIAALAVNVQPAHTQWYNAEWCTDGSGHGESGNPECAYFTLQQCRAAASGRGMHCMRNPEYAWRERGYDRREGRRRGDY
jgi:hypothetical protein